ncbi:MAG: polyribonucleotide nucleotidyltransferase [Phaeodactylibacter sp.]|nr:polyribonucleotide nucleotidyltransferase [Phaeodactylibacter sp.]MCB9051751.1 polyribonucleotide nucleotidyltransferase [Lewinellaceae bacterium]
MGQQIPTTTSFDLPDGRTVTIETGKLATQADGSVVVRMGKTMLFATVVSAKEAKEGQSFFPLSVDYQEKFAAAGRIPGNFFRREAKLSDYEVLICRLVDRAIRPLFPDGYMNETQVIINLISGDADVPPDAFAALAASAALAVSDIPFGGPISEVRVALIDGEYVVNPNKSALENAELDIIVAATLDNVIMVEGEAKECSEKDLVKAIQAGHDAIKVQCNAQLELAKLVGEKALKKRELEPVAEDEGLKKEIAAFAQSRILEVAKGALDKQVRKDRFSEIKESLIETFTEQKGEEYMEEHGSMVEEYFDKLKKEVIRNMVITDKVRLDGRKLDEIRPIWCEVDYLPSAHGSAVFTRGETQALTSLTLGTKQDEVMVDIALGQYFDNFILHYNFPAFSVGEIKPQRGPGRREVGHANLAGRSLRQVMPKESPYTIRIVSDILESNGSSSMATVCAGSLALMDAGIHIASPVSGIAMGMISDGKNTVILSDILGDEDALGDMDFKLTGTENGITACQMDIKIDGLPYELLEQALEQARAGRLHILNEMKKTLAEPRPELKPHAPRIVELIIDKSFIGAVIGPGGKVIQEIQSETGTIVNISEVGDTGVVNIAATDQASIEAALERIRRITFTPSVGDIYDAKVKSVMPYGVFVDFMGKSGLLHVSEISHTRIDRVEDFFKEGDEVRVQLIGVDKKTGKLRLSRKSLLPKPQRNGKGEEEEDGREEERDNRGGRGRDRDRRGGRRDDRRRD